ncbi:MAG: hypothetical protein JEZ09_15945 [Salinivirgaceae bacterium]|nr:hypothetical protein [Salinivirgaceae bacterium]
MKKNDFLFIAVTLLIILPLVLWDKTFNAYLDFNRDHGMITSFIKFGILATLGEVLGLRVRTGKFYQKGFGLIPKAVIWGFIGLTIKLSFVIFATGTPIFLSYLGIEGAVDVMKQPFSSTKLLVAFSISVAMNVMYAPIMMTFHKLTDLHISEHQGKIQSIYQPINFAKNFKLIDWDVQWNFVFKKTIPFFWIPAHTLTFLMPSEFQVLFAAVLSVVLGLILALASLKSQK